MSLKKCSKKGVYSKKNVKKGFLSFFKFRIRETKNLSTNADSRIDTIFERLHDLSKFFLSFFLLNFLLKKISRENHGKTKGKPQENPRNTQENPGETPDRGGGHQWEVGIWSFDLRANERPWKNFMKRGQIYPGLDIGTLWKNRHKGRFFEKCPKKWVYSKECWKKEIHP